MKKKTDELAELRHALDKIEMVIAARTYLGGKEVETAFALRTKGQNRLADAGALAKELNTFADAQLAQIKVSRGSLESAAAAKAAEAQAEEQRVKAAEERHRAQQEALRQRQQDAVAFAAVAEAIG